jgi:hypothetical protein
VDLSNLRIGGDWEGSLVKRILSGFYVVMSVLGGILLIASIPSYSFFGREIAVFLLTLGAYMFVALGVISVLLIWKKVADESPLILFSVFLFIGALSAVLKYIWGFEEALLGIYVAVVGMVVTALFRFTPDLFPKGQEPTL